jgi:hypothetical protein
VQIVQNRRELQQAQLLVVQQAIEIVVGTGVSAMGQFSPSAQLTLTL